MGDEETIQIIKQIQIIAKKMANLLENDNINEFAKLLNNHWDLLKKLDKDCSNTCIEFIFESIKDLIDGRFICGAGGGGFLVVVLKENVTKNEIDKRIHQIFSDTLENTWSIEIV